MKTCEWCANDTDNLIEYNGNNICDKCHKSVTNSKCRKCQDNYPEDLMLKGLCLSCLQIEETKRAEKREEAKVGMGYALQDYESSSTKMTEEDYEQWVTFGARDFTPAEFKRSKTLRRLWIVFKLNIVGINDDIVINENINDIESLLDANFSKLINNKCKFVIIQNMADRKKTAGMKCIAHKNKVYIMQVQ